MRPLRDRPGGTASALGAGAVALVTAALYVAFGRARVPVAHPVAIGGIVTGAGATALAAAYVREPRLRFAALWLAASNLFVWGFITLLYAMGVALLGACVLAVRAAAAAVGRPTRWRAVGIAAATAAVAVALALVFYATPT